MLSYGFWRRWLSGDAHAVDRTLNLNGHLYIVTGVLRRDYRSIVGHGVSPEVYVIASPSSAHCRLFGRLRDGVTRSQTRDALLTAGRNIGGEDFARRVAVLGPMAGLAANASDHRFFMFFVMLFGTATILALIACLNVAGLLLARGAGRQRELAVRKALGASRRHIIRQLLAEGAELVALGAAVGLVLDAFLRHQLSYVRWPSAYNLPLEFHFQNDRGLFLYALAAALITLLLFSLPAVCGPGADLSLAMKQGEPAFSILRWNLRNGFVALQLALSVVLLSVGLLFVRSFLHLANTNPGFNITDNVIVQAYQPPGQGLGEEAGWAWSDRIAEIIKQVPGVTGVTSVGGPSLRSCSDSAVDRHHSRWR